MELLIDGNKINNKEELFINLKKQINSPEFYGDNLDALWDVLTSFKGNMLIKIINSDLLNKKLGNYYLSLIELFKDLTNEYKKINLIII